MHLLMGFKLVHMSLIHVARMRQHSVSILFVFFLFPQSKGDSPCSYK